MIGNLNSEQKKAIVKALGFAIWILSSWVIFLIGFTVYSFYIIHHKPDASELVIGTSPHKKDSGKPQNLFWLPPAESTLDGNPDKDQILYGKKIVSNTALYFGPKGKVAARSTNGMNCQNCHLEAGTKIFGNNYSAVATTYPKYRARSGKTETIYKRVNDCFERSLNGKGLDTNSKEMQAISQYIQWLGKDVEKGKKPEGSGLKEMTILDRACDPVKGKVIYMEKCQVCHSKNGDGQTDPKTGGFVYPPLWGPKSYNVGAGLYRISNFARYVKTNMPLGSTHKSAQLSDEEAWDVAAFVNSQEHPAKDLSEDWPNISEKPFDHPFGPFSDGFNEKQHKFGPYKPIIEFQKAKKSRTI
jgi:thiosulfate dehydrogenase